SLIIKTTRFFGATDDTQFRWNCDVGYVSNRKSAAQKVARRAHEYLRSDRDQVVWKIIVRVVQGGIPLAGSEEEHRRSSIVAEYAEIFRRAHRQAFFSMGDALFIQRAPQMLYGVFCIDAGNEDFVI